MKALLPCVLLIAGAGLMKASIVESISLNLSAIHAGSTLSGTFTLSNTPAVGNTAPVVLSFSDPSDYSTASLTSTITIQSGLPSGFMVVFSGLTFTNLSGVTTPIDTKDVDITPYAFASCASFPCSASGLFQDQSPAVFSGTYTIAPAATPEPTSIYELIPVCVALGLIGKKRLSRSVSGSLW